MLTPIVNIVNILSPLESVVNFNNVLAKDRATFLLCRYTTLCDWYLLTNTGHCRGS